MTMIRNAAAACVLAACVACGGSGDEMPAGDQVKGTAGTPTVQSTTKVEMKRLQVASVTPVDGDCDDE